MKQRMSVSEIMSKNVITANTTDSLRRVSSMLKENNIRHIPILEGNKLVGIVSKTDIMRLSFGDMFEGQGDSDEALFDLLTLAQVMVSDPVTINADELIKDVAEKFTKIEFHALPVLKDDKVVGIVSTTDLIKYLLDQYN
ncbi:MAG TPA: CBS domain-containing protein [Edaphocola sp.]|nr:CBS domain-containing protein [Edaphocola sp.]